MRSLFLPLTMPLVALFVACSGGNPSTSQTASTDKASFGIGSSGGIVLLPDGSSASIPRGALSRDVTISIEINSSAPAPGEGTPVGSTYLLGPEGQSFDAPVTVTLAFDPSRLPPGEAASDVVIFTAPRDSSEYTPLETTLVDSLHVSATTSHFSNFVPLIAPRESVDPGNPTNIRIGWNGGVDQFAYYADFFTKEAHYEELKSGERYCHWYVPWDIACNPSDPTCADASSAPPPVTMDCNASEKSLPYLACWLGEAQGNCDEALISFQGHGPAREDEIHFENAFKIFLAWAKSAGLDASYFAFTPWNEPNNPAGSGNALCRAGEKNGKPDCVDGRVIGPDEAAKYYLMAETACKAKGCKVAAGDFASNGGFWNDFEWNCAFDDVPEKDLCKEHSKFDKGKHPKRASYLDRYKSYIFEHRNDKAYGLGDHFFPEYFAFHGWHDINEFLEKGILCTDYSNCVTRRLLQSLGGQWKRSEIWDTEAGVGQGKNPKTNAIYTPKEQACGAAFLLDVTALDKRITRLYYTRLHNDDPKQVPQQLEVAHETGGVAFNVIAARSPYLAGQCWRGEKLGSPPPVAPKKSGSSGGGTTCGTGASGCFENSGSGSTRACDFNTSTFPGFTCADAPGYSAGSCDTDGLYGCCVTTTQSGTYTTTQAICYYDASIGAAAEPACTGGMGGVTQAWSACPP
jgi:hypothetical protein